MNYEEIMEYEDKRFSKFVKEKGNEFFKANKKGTSEPYKYECKYMDVDEVIYEAQRYVVFTNNKKRINKYPEFKEGDCVSVMTRDNFEIAFKEIK